MIIRQSNPSQFACPICSNATPFQLGQKTVQCEGCLVRFFAEKRSTEMVMANEHFYWCSDQEIDNHRLHQKEQERPPMSNINLYLESELTEKQEEIDPAIMSTEEIDEENEKYPATNLGSIK